MTKKGQPGRNDCFVYFRHSYAEILYFERATMRAIILAAEERRGDVVIERGNGNWGYFSLVPL